MSLKVCKDWLAAPVSMHARRPRRKRPSITKPPLFIRYLGRYGSSHLIEFLHRGKPTLRYMHETPAELLTNICDPHHQSIVTPVAS
jgi:hypothetical protein